MSKCYNSIPLENAKKEINNYISRNRPKHVYIKVSSESIRPIYDANIKKIVLTKQGLNWNEDKKCFIGERESIAELIKNNKNKKVLSNFTDSNFRFLYLRINGYKVNWAFDKKDLPRKKVYFAVIEQPKVYQGMLLPEEGAAMRIEERLKKGRSFKIFSIEELTAANKYIGEIGGDLRYIYSSREISMMQALDLFDYLDPNKNKMEAESYD